MNLNKILGMIILSNAFVSRLSACDNDKHITHPDSFYNQEVDSLIDNYENITISKDAKDLWTWTGN